VGDSQEGRGKTTDHDDYLEKGVSEGPKNQGVKRLKKYQGIDRSCKALGWYVPALRYSSLNDC
jgi:hypothetical protein